ncbi:MAG: hydrolase [Candidatus Binatia bacterium]|nr:MAG: hydrolase [Candidatus Binatia bacterium]
MEKTTTQILVRGRKIHEIRGGEGKPLLYLHSAAGDALWLPHLEGLARHYEVHAPAHPGFLGSEGIEEIRDIEDYAYHYLDYMDAKGWSSVDVVGVSLGGWIAAELAARWPEKVSRLVLVNAVGIWVRERPIADIFALDTRFPERFKQLLFHDVNCPAAQMMPGPGQVGELPEEMVVNFMNAMAATAKVGWNPLLHDPRLERILHRVKAPTLCLWSENDRVVPPVYGRKYAELIPGAKLEIVRECGHLLPFEKPEVFVEKVRAFLG